MMATNGKENHVRVYVRVRPLSLTEKKFRNVAIVECSGSKDVKVKERSHTLKSKSFNFNQVFGPDSKQIGVYQSVLSPMIDEVLSGYNCTVFAYGQTGSGKTFTMVGERSVDPNISWDVDPLSGLIPRALSHLFDKLVNFGYNYVVRVSYLELYNEELIDLLSNSDDVPKLKLYEDSTRKGGVIVQGLEEVEVSTKAEIYRILERGSLKRQMAATRMNSQSSRSHTVFTITLHIKEILTNEEVVKTGRLNLVDLAGSENIGRSGSIDKRAREAGNINQSLLTLGRVITALTENAPHIPYRESKLTRLLQESLGGCTKTSIIATISPASSNLDETLSTLEYAFRARKITNRPQINQKLTRKALITEYTEEIERLRRDLLCNREKSGVYLGYDDYMHMLVNLEHLQEERQRKLATLASLNEQMKACEELCDKLSMKTESKMRTQQELSNCLSEVTTEFYEKTHLLKKHEEAERQLVGQAKLLQSVADETSSHVHRLHDKLSRVALLENENVERCGNFKNDEHQKLYNMNKHIAEVKQTSGVFHANLKTTLGSQLERRMQDYKSVQEVVSSCPTQLEECVHQCESDNSEDVMKTKQMEQHISNSMRQVEGSLAQKWQSFMDLAESLLKQAEEAVCAEEKETESLRNVQGWQYLEQSQKTLEECDAIERSVKQYQELDEQEYGVLQRTVEDMMQNQLQLNNEIERLDTHVKTVADTLQARVSRNKECVAENKDLDVLKSSIVEMFKRQRETCGLLDNMYAEQSAHIASQGGVAAKNAAPHLTNAVHNLSCLDVAAPDIVKSNEAAWGECTGKSLEELDRLREHLHMNNQMCLQHAGTLDSIVKEAVSKSTSTICRQEADLMTMADSCHVSLDSQLDYVRKWALEMVDKIKQRENDVNEFVNTGLCKELRTGQTPDRKEFHYPREIASCSPDERILERFRASASYRPSDAAVEAEGIDFSLADAISSGSPSSASQSSLTKCN